MTVCPDVRAGTDSHVAIDHRVFAHPRADISEAGHQHRAGRDIGTAPHNRAGHGTELGAGKIIRTPVGEFQRHLVVSARQRDAGAKAEG